MTSGAIDRRAMLRGTGAAAVAALSGPAIASAKPSLKLDPNNKQDVSLIFRKLAYSLDDRTGFWWLEGRRFILIDSETTPLWDMHIGLLFTTRDLPNGDYDVVSMSMNFYTDIETGKYIKQFKNPFTNKTLDIGYFPPKPSTRRFGVDGLEDKPTGALAGLRSIGAIGPAWIQGDQVWMWGDHLLRSPADSPHPIRVNDLTTYIGLVRDVADPAVKMAPASQAFTDINTWPPWLGMDDMPGSYYSRVWGHKVSSYDRMPALWQKLVAQEYPDIAKDPVGALKG